jgi:hypothetical protein
LPEPRITRKRKHLEGGSREARGRFVGRMHQAHGLVQQACWPHGLGPNMTVGLKSYDTSGYPRVVIGDGGGEVFGLSRAKAAAAGMTR